MLPSPWIDKIFAKLTLVYGHDFLNRWRDLDIEAVKADWAHELAGFKDHPDALAHALQHLPSNRPPTVLEFRDIARKRPPPVFKALPAPKADPERVRALISELKSKFSNTKGAKHERTH